MNIEISYIHLIRNGLRFWHHGGRALAAIRTFLRRPATVADRCVRSDTLRAHYDRERYCAGAMAQIQSYRFSR